MKRYSLWLYVCVFSAASIAVAQRLPGTAAPENYKLTIEPDFSKDNFAGDETIQVRLLKPVTEIVLNAAELDIHDVSITNQGKTQKGKVNLSKEDETATLTVAEGLQPGLATIHMTFTGILNDQLRGFYLGKDEQGHKYAVTQFAATDTRRAFPCFDEPAYKATFDITLIADKWLIAVSNTKVISDDPGPGEKHTVHFATSPKMSSYLAAFAVGNFEYIEGAAEGIPIRVYSMPGKKQLGKFALQAAENALTYYNRYFEIQYPYGKLDLMALPDFSAGAMENIGFITGREIALQVDEQHSSLGSQKLVALVVSHEIAHQWFGDLVTTGWWDDIWLNEGFATWMESKPVDVWKPDWNVGLDQISRGDLLTTLGAFDVDSLASTRAIHQAAETPGQILELFDGIAYGKAAAVLRMIEAYIGPGSFRAGVNEYLKRYAYGNATAEDFWGTLAEVSKKPVDRIMATFVKQPGVPLVRLTTKCTGNVTTVSMKQQRYFYDRTKLDSPGDQLWQVPVCLKAGPAPESGWNAPQCELLTKREESFTIPGCPTWVLGNAGGNGYYRTGYEPEAVRALARDAETSLTAPERILLLSDTWASVEVGQQPVGDYLALTEGIQNESVAAILSMVLDRVNAISRYVVNDDDRAAYQLWVRNTLNPVARRIGWQAQAGESEEAKNLRPLLLVALGRDGRDPEAIAEAHKLTGQALQDLSSVPADLVGSAFRVAASDSGPELYDKMLAAMKNAKTPEQYYLYLYTLANFSAPQLLQRTLEFAISPEVRSQDGLGLIGWVMNNPDGEKLAWDFVRAHWAEVEKAGGPFASAQIEDGVGAFCDPVIKDQAKEFFSAHGSPAAERGFRQSMERIANCIAMKAQQSGQLASWLQGRSSSAGN
jgi:aminopeptidase N